MIIDKSNQFIPVTSSKEHLLIHFVQWRSCKWSLTCDYKYITRRTYRTLLYGWLEANHWHCFLLACFLSNIQNCQKQWHRSSLWSSFCFCVRIMFYMLYSCFDLRLVTSDVWVGCLYSGLFQCFISLFCSLYSTSDIIIWLYFIYQGRFCRINAKLFYNYIQFFLLI